MWGENEAISIKGILFEVEILRARTSVKKDFRIY